MPIYSKKNNEKIIISTISIDPDCYIGNTLVKFRASVDKPRVFYLRELVEDPPGEITRAIDAILHPEQTIRPLWQLERDAIFDALAWLRGDKPAAAEKLGIGRATLYQKLKEYDATLDHPLYLKMRQAAKKIGEGDQTNEAKDELPEAESTE